MCLFQEWASLAEEVVAHEFPSWHLFAAFEVFNLADEGKRQNPDVVRNLQRLAQAFAVCPEKLKEQYARLMPIATAIKKQGGLSNRDAWKEALQQHEQPQGRPKPEARALGPEGSHCSVPRLDSCQQRGGTTILQIEKKSSGAFQCIR